MTKAEIRKMERLERLLEVERERPVRRHTIERRHHASMY